MDMRGRWATIQSSWQYNNDADTENKEDEEEEEANKARKQQQQALEQGIESKEMGSVNQ
jgi:hypothetical protein